MFVRPLLLKSLAVLIAASITTLPMAAAAAPTAADSGVPAQLAKIEAALQRVTDALLPPIVPKNSTRLLFPYVTNQAGFDTGIAVSNTGLDSTGTVGKAGTCTIRYFGAVAGGGPAAAPQTTNAVIPPGGQLTFVISSGGGFGIQGRPGFQGYIEITCDFPFAHGYALLTDGPIGAARVGASIPALVLPIQRTNAFEEAAGL
jgi:hypothetical protein